MDNPVDQTKRFTVYFDGSCPLCIREIGYYQRRSGADQIDWVDVSEGTFCTVDLSCTAAMAKFHVRGADGTLYGGGEAFARLWRELPAFQWLGRLFVLPGFRHALNVGYKLFLPLRPSLQRLARGPRASAR